jgi:hypothetical protein
LPLVWITVMGRCHSRLRGRSDLARLNRGGHLPSSICPREPDA